MANVYNTIYRGYFCNSFGDNIFIDFNRRMLDTDPVPEVTPIIFAGENQSPLRLIYKDDGDYKINPINGSELVINIKAIGDFELSSMYTADEREWFVDVYGARAWQGWIIPDSCSEPFMSKPYDVTIRATDALGTLKDLPFQADDGTKYVGKYRDREVLRLALAKTGLSLDLLIGVNTFEQSMDDTLQTGSLGQSYIDVARFLDENRVPFSCYDVIASILRRYSARLHQHNYKWQVINVLEKSEGNVFSRFFSPSGTWSGNSTIGNVITAGGQDRTIHPLGNIKLAKALLSSTGYYQYGYITNQLINGNFDTWTTKPTGLADDWVIVNVVGTVIATMGIRQVDGVDTTDYYLIISGSGNGWVQNTNDVQVRANDRGQVSFDLYAPDAYGNNISDADNRYLDVLITDDLGKYYTNTGWSGTFGFYSIKYKNPSVFDKQISVRFDITPQEVDFTIKFAVQAVGKADGTNYATQINNVNIDSGFSDAATQPPIGAIYREEQLVPQTYVQESILLLHADDPNSQRTSPITINDDNDVILPDGIGVPSQLWSREGITESLPLLFIATDTELRLHSRPYRVFEAEFVPTGFDEIDINTLLTVDLVEADFIFLSGEFDWKKDIHTLRFAEVLTDAVPFVSTLKEDYGKSNEGSLVSSPAGVSGGGSGGSFVDLSGYAKLTDIPVKASDAETQTGTDDAKFVTPLKLANWWAWVKTQVQTISALWTFNGGLTVTGTVTLPATTSIGTVSNTEIGYLDGVTSAIQTQINEKAPIDSPTFTTQSTAPISYAGQFRLTALNTAPASSTAAGVLGEIRIDANFIYICTATNVWVRSPLVTF